MRNKYFRSREEASLESKFSEQQTSIDSVTQNCQQIANKPYRSEKVKLLSESIFGSGNFVSKFEADIGCDAQEAIFSGSHISAALAEEADSIYAPCTGENSVKYSNDLTQWTVSAGSVVKTRETLRDGLIWNKLVKNDSVSWGGVHIDTVASYPTGATGVVVSLDVYIPEGTTPAPAQSFRIGVSNRTTLAADKVQFVTGLEAGKSYRVIWVCPLSEFSTWVQGAGDTIRFMLYLNSSDSHAPCTIYVRNISVAWKCVGGFEKYVGTTTAVASPGEVGWVKINRNPYSNPYDFAVVSYGRNEANDGVHATSHRKAYDRLIASAMSRCGGLIPTNPPPKYNVDTHEWAADDAYVLLKYDVEWDMLVKKWNVGSDINALMRAETNPQSLMADAWHQNDEGSDVMVSHIHDEVVYRKTINRAMPELYQGISYYLYGVPTGTWYKQVVQGIDERLISNSNGIAMVSSVANSELTFPSVDCTQIHVVCRQDSSYGTFSVIIDEGTANEIIKTIATNMATDRLHGHFVCDFGQIGTHTVKVKVISGTVKIHGIVTL